jgi:hypothetical protein
MVLDRNTLEVGVTNLFKMDDITRERARLGGQRGTGVEMREN